MVLYDLIADSRKCIFTPYIGQEQKARLANENMLWNRKFSPHKSTFHCKISPEIIIITVGHNNSYVNNPYDLKVEWL